LFACPGEQEQRRTRPVDLEGDAGTVGGDSVRHDLSTSVGCS
jgi:hypothetical protein